MLLSFTYAMSDRFDTITVRRSRPLYLWSGLDDQVRSSWVCGKKVKSYFIWVTVIYAPIICTHLFSLSQERLSRLYSHLVCG